MRVIQGDTRHGEILAITSWPKDIIKCILHYSMGDLSRLLVSARSNPQFTIFLKVQLTDNRSLLSKHCESLAIHQARPQSP